MWFLSNHLWQRDLGDLLDLCDILKEKGAIGEGTE